MIRTINVCTVTETIKEMCMEANYYLSEDMNLVLKESARTEKSEIGRKILNQLEENLKLRAKKRFQFVRIPEWQWFLWKSDRIFILKVEI